MIQPVSERRDLKLSEKQLFEYLCCPVKYNLIYERNIRPQEEISETELLKKVCSRFYHELMGGRVLELSELKCFWDRLCEKHKNRISQKAALDGLGKITKLFQWAQSVELTVVDSGAPYRLVFEREHGNVELAGKTGTIASGKGGLYLLETDFSNACPEQSILNMKLKYSIDMLAMNVNYGMDLCMKVHHVKNCRDYYTVRQKEDYERLTESVKAVAESVDRKIFYPRETAFCRNCSCLGFCRMWRR